MRLFSACIVVFFLSLFSVASNLAGTYQEAVAIGVHQEGALQTKDYLQNTLMPYYEQQYTPVLQSCFSRVTLPDASSFSFVVAIGDDGRVLRIYDDRETNIYQCVRESLKKEVFPRPPASPFYLHIDMRFDNNQAAAKVAAPSSEPKQDSLGAAARQFREEKAQLSASEGPPDWATGPPKSNNDPISEPQLVGWVAGGAPSEDVIAEMKKRGIAFLPSNDLSQLLTRAGAEEPLLQELPNAARTGPGVQNPEEMAALAKVIDAMGQKNYVGAIRGVVSLLKSDSKNPGIYVLAGHLVGEQEEWPNMAGAFSAAIQLDRDFAYSHGQLSYACYRMEQPCDKSEAEAMVSLQPRGSDAHKYLGLAYSGMEDFPSALAEYQKALALGSKAPDLIYYDIALAKEKTDFQGAVDAYHQSIKINSHNWHVFYAMGNMYIDSGNVPEGVANLQKAKSLAPDHLEVRQNLGAAFCNSGQHAEAVVEFQELLELDPDWNMARPCLAKSLRAIGRSDEAQKIMEEYYRRESD